MSWEAKISKSNIIIINEDVIDLDVVVEDEFNMEQMDCVYYLPVELIFGFVWNGLFLLDVLAQLSIWAILENETMESFMFYVFN